MCMLLSGVVPMIVLLAQSQTNCEQKTRFHQLVWSKGTQMSAVQPTIRLVVDRVEEETKLGKVVIFG